MYFPANAHLSVIKIESAMPYKYRRNEAAIRSQRYQYSRSLLESSIRLVLKKKLELRELSTISSFGPSWYCRSNWTSANASKCVHSPQFQYLPTSSLPLISKEPHRHLIAPESDIARGGSPC